MKKYYKVIGHIDNKSYVLGYTSNKWAWIRNSNGWKKNQLEFIKLIKKDENKKS
jgi:hypothetical protein